MNREAKMITRYVITILNAAGDLRSLAFAAQGRYTYETREVAQTNLELYREGLLRVFGDRVNTLEVREVECWPGHLDPKRTVFEN